MTTGPEDAAAPRLTTDWVYYRPSGVPGVSREVLGWDVEVKRWLMAECGWTLLDLTVYETLYRLVDVHVVAEHGAVLQWIGTYEQLAVAIGGGNDRVGKDGRGLFGKRALSGARDRLEERALLHTETVRSTSTDDDGNFRVRTEGMVWRLLGGAEAAYEQRQGGSSGRAQAVRAGGVAPRDDTRLQEQPGGVAPRDATRLQEQSGGGAPRDASDGQGGGTGGASRDHGQDGAQDRGDASRDPRQQRSPGGDREAIPEQADAGRSVAVRDAPRSPSSSPPPLEGGGHRDAPRIAGPAAAVLHLLEGDRSQEVVDEAVAALERAGWVGGGARRFVVGLGWRCLAVVPLLEHWSSQLGERNKAIGFTRRALEPGRDGDATHVMGPDELVAMILEHAEEARGQEVELDEQHQRAVRELLDWVNTGSDQHGGGAVERWGPRLLELAEQRGQHPRTVLDDRTAVAELLGLLEETGPASAGGGVVAPGDDPGSRPAGGGVAAPDDEQPRGGAPGSRAAGGVDELDEQAVAVLLEDPLVGSHLQHVAARTSQPDRRLLLAAVALEVLAGDLELDQVPHDPRVRAAERGVGVQVRAHLRGLGL